MEIKVLGPGCPKCKQTEQHVREAVAEAGITAKIEKSDRYYGNCRLRRFGHPRGYHRRRG